MQHMACYTLQHQMGLLLVFGNWHGGRREPDIATWHLMRMTAPLAASDNLPVMLE
jgi:hypothetical protein